MAGRTLREIPRPFPPEGPLKVSLPLGEETIVVFGSKFALTAATREQSVRRGRLYVLKAAGVTVLPGRHADHVLLPRETMGRRSTITIDPLSESKAEQVRQATPSDPNVPIVFIDDQYRIDRGGIRRGPNGREFLDVMVTSTQPFTTTTLEGSQINYLDDFLGES